MDHRSLRDQTTVMSSSTSSAAARQHNKFTVDVIRAIEELEIRRINKPSQQLADAAWQKLQFDLPVLEVAELQALLEHLRCDVSLKQPLTGYWGALLSLVQASCVSPWTSLHVLGVYFSGHRRYCSTGSAHALVVSKEGRTSCRL